MKQKYILRGFVFALLALFWLTVIPLYAESPYGATLERVNLQIEGMT